ncbi:exonuclease V-like isoform X1 [Oncorhynchus clarkii lewisi]|uniref:exonuclease V-like isoform X1 n=1 Tax=Oncorhynchus clarkii lewisi TaxID=490388 RepID=UPI0039B9C555
MNSNITSTEPSDDWGDISDAELLDVQSEHLAPPDRSSPTLGGNVGDDGQSLETTEKRIDYLIKKWPNLAHLFERVKNRSTALSVPNQSPMERFLKRHLSVTQLCEQSWCEVKMAYGFIKPKVRMLEMQNTEVTTGASIHLARELEVKPNVVTVAAVTREDREALKLINMLQMVSALETGQLVREFPVFGVLEGMFFMGVVDELNRSDSGELVLSELKTRSHNSLPRPAQTKGHALQVGMYKLLFDSMVKGSVKRDHLLHNLQLDPNRVLGSDLQTHTQSLGLQAVTFRELLDHLLVVLTCSNLHAIDKLRLEYSHQSSGKLIGTREVAFEEAQLRTNIRGYLAYWRGERVPQGVEVEEAWKCRMCPYEETCDWRRDRSQRLMMVNKRAKLECPKSDDPKPNGSNLNGSKLGVEYR